MKPIPTPDPLVIEPVIKTVDVPLPVEKAFHLFTEGYARWWPIATHSVGLKRALSCTLETHVGGRIYETLDDGTHCEWGTVQIWEPPHRLVFTWHPGRPASTAQQVEILIQPAPGGSQLTLTHSGWEILGAQALETRQAYQIGWDPVLASFASLTLPSLIPRDSSP